MALLKPLLKYRLYATKLFVLCDTSIVGPEYHLAILIFPLLA